MFRLVLIFCGIAVIGCANRSNTRVISAPNKQLTNLAQITKGAAAAAKAMEFKNPSLRPRSLTPSSVVKILPPQHRIALSYHHTSLNGVILSMVSFDDREHQLRVADQQNGLGTRWLDAKSAAATYRGLAAINGGFFTPEGKPLGLVIETGTKRGYINKSSLGAGIYISTKSGSTIIRRKKYASSSLAANAHNLLQTGPMLAESGKAISGLSKRSSRVRSFIAWDGRNHWAIGHAEPCTLDALSKALAGASPAGFKISTAANLDGGRSSDLWVGSRVKNGGKTHRTFFNKAVRNYLVLTPR